MDKCWNSCRANTDVSPGLRAPGPQNNNHVIKSSFSIFRVSSLKLQPASTSLPWQSVTVRPQHDPSHINNIYMYCIWFETLKSGIHCFFWYRSLPLWKSIISNRYWKKSIRVLWKQPSLVPGLHSLMLANTKYNHKKRIQPQPCDCPQSGKDKRGRF